MAKFFVGQRVRVLHTKLAPYLLGREGVIVELYDGKFGYRWQSTNEPYWYVKIDGWSSCIDPTSGRFYCPPESFLEPILDANDGITDEVHKELDRILSHEREGVAA